MFGRSCFARFTAQPLVPTAVQALTRLVALDALLLALFCVPVASLLAQTPTPVMVPTWRYDLTHAGQNTDETALTPANVNVTSFGKLFSLKVDGSVYAQPLYVPGLTMSDGQVHNVLFVATENDSIYAFDANSNGGVNASPIWKISLLDAAHGAGAGATAVPYKDAGSPDVAPLIGITGTPAINPATNTMYVVAATKENGAYFSRLHAINILTGAEQANSPVEIKATVAGTGQGSSGGQLSFDPLVENQRAALNYYKGHVYIGFAAHGDVGPWHGWLFAYDATTLTQTAMICLSPNGLGSGIWGSGAGMPIDEDAPGGRMFVSTGNGPHTPNVKFPFSGSTGYGESVVDFNLANGGLTATDDFTAFNYADLNDGDLDLGSGGILMVPDQQAEHPHILVVAGKEARIMVLDRDDLGGYNTTANNVLQDIPGKIKGLWGTPAYWNGKVYIWSENDVAKAFDLDNGVMDTDPTTESTITSAFPSPTFSISSNGTQDGIAWAVRSDQFNTHGPLVLYAWDATDLTTPIYESDTDSQRDAGGAANRYSIPVVTNGKVYVSANGEVDVYGLFNGEPNAAAPTIAPNGGTFAASQNITLSTATTSASIYYTLDGSTPTPASMLYTGPIAIGTDTTVRAMASAAGFIQSGVSSATFTFSDQTPLLSFHPAAGTYTATQSVTISNPDANAKIYYTLDGSTPSASSSLYSNPIRVPVSETIKAIAIDPSLRNSNVGTAAYVIQGGGSSINFGNGFSSTTGLTLNGNAVATNDTRLQLTNGGLQQAGSVFWNTPISIQAFTTDFQFQISSALGNGFTFTIQNVGATALGANAAGLGYQGIGKSVAIKFNFHNDDNEGSDSTGVYTNGEPPTLPTVDLTPSGIQLASGDSIEATITYDGATLTLNLHDQVTDDTFTMSQAIDIPQIVGGNTAYVGFTGSTSVETASQKLLTWTYSTQSAPPIFAPAAGTYHAAQSVTLSSATTDAAIYYSTDGNTPDAASHTYSGPIAVAASETIKAIAISPTVGSSNVMSAAYTIQAASAGTFSLSATPTTAIAPGDSTTSTITITPSGGFTGSVALTCAVSPAGTTAPTCSATQPAAISGTGAVTSTLTINTQVTTSPGNYTVTVTGTSGSTVETTSVTALIVMPSFALSGTPVSIASPGASGTSTITITPNGGFTGSVALTCAVSPAGTTAPTCSAAQPTAISGTGAVTSTLTINTQATTTPGNYTVTVTGTSGSTVETTNVAINVTAPVVTPSFALSGTPISIASPGASGTSTITITPSGGFTGSVALTCAVSPAGTTAPTCSATQPAAISGTGAVTSTLTINTQATTTPGNYTVTVTGTSGSTVETTNVAITVTAPIITPSFVLSVTPISIASPGASGTSTITITPSGGFTGSVALTCAVTASPSGAIDMPTCSAAQPTAISGTNAVTSTLTINTTAASTAALHNPLQRILNLGGGGTLAALLFFCLPFRRRKWQTLFSLLLLLAISAAAIGCGSSSSMKGSDPGTSGTTAGNYTVTVTGTSGSTKANTTVSVTVQ